MAGLAERIESIAPAAPERSAFWIDEPGRLWFVAEGALDVFAQRRGNGGEALGARHHIYRARAGQIALGVDFPPAADWAFVGVPLPGSRLARLGTAEFGGALADPAAAAEALRMFADWVVATTRAVNRTLPPRQYRSIVAGETLEAEPGESISPGERLLWLQMAEGDALWLGRDALPVNRASGVCPVNKDMFLVASGKLRAGTVDPTALLADGSIWRALALHHGFVLRYALLSMDEASAADAERLVEKASRSTRLTREAIGRLMAVTQRRTQAGKRMEKEERLLGALDWVGGRLGLVFRAPPRYEAEAAERDPIGTICATSDVRYRQVALKGEWWQTDAGPLLASVGDSKEWVALLPEKGKRYQLHDPATGEVRRVTPELAATLGAFAYTFYRPLPSRALRPFDLLVFGAHGLAPDIGWIVALGVLAGLLGMAMPIAGGKLVDTIIPSADVAAIWMMVGALGIASVTSMLFEVARSIAVLRVESKADGSVQAAVWDRVLKLPVPFFRNYVAGDLAVRINGINTIRHALSGSTVHTVLGSLFSLFNFFLLFYYSVKLAAVAIALVAVAVLVTLAVGFFKLRYERQLAEVLGRLSGLTYQYLRGIGKLRVAAAESRAFVNWTDEFSRFRRLSFSAEHLENVEHTFFAGYQVAVSAALFAAIGLFLAKDAGAKLSTGDFIAFSAAFGVFFGGLMGLAQTGLGLLNLVPLYERAKPILQTLPEVEEARAHPGQLQGGIEATRLGFRYGDGPPVLTDVTLSIRPGGFIALVGPSGSGKSTLLRLLLGFERATTGSVYYDNQDIADLDLHALRRQLGVVLQSGQLMTGDIFTNIVGASPLPLDDAWEAARMVGLDEDINRMPMGMHTVISEGTSTLSGGQRQRILIARAIVNRPSILFFDEATSALDNRTQAIVTRSLEQLKATRVVIAHRLSTVINADRILVLQHGRIVQEGNYAKLMAEPGPFRELAERQIADAPPDDPAAAGRAAAG